MILFFIVLPPLLWISTPIIASLGNDFMILNLKRFAEIASPSYISYQLRQFRLSQLLYLYRLGLNSIFTIYFWQNYRSRRSIQLNRLC